MRCPFCREDNDRVIDSRVVDEGFSIRRRRHCLNCGRRYTTYERPEEIAIKVVKKDGCREPFRREKIRQGLERACWKRPISDEQIDRLVSDIESDVYADFESEIESRTLGELVMEHLRDLDQVAFVRFASVYREFKDVNDFVHELQPILRDRESRPRDAGRSARTGQYDRLTTNSAMRRSDRFAGLSGSSVSCCSACSANARAFSRA